MKELFVYSCLACIAKVLTANFLLQVLLSQGSYAVLVNANYDKLIEGPSEAAQNSTTKNIKQPGLVIHISCMARKLFLDQRGVEEGEVVRVIYEKKAITSFYTKGNSSFI